MKRVPEKLVADLWLTREEFAVCEGGSTGAGVWRIEKRIRRKLAPCNGTRALYERRDKSQEGGGSGGTITRWNAFTLQRDFPGLLRGNYAAFRDAVLIPQAPVAESPAQTSLALAPPAAQLAIVPANQKPQNVSPKKWKKALARWQIIEPILSGAFRTTTSFRSQTEYEEATAKQHGIGVSTLRLWLRKARQLNPATQQPLMLLGLVPKEREDIRQWKKPLTDPQKDELRAHWNRGMTARACWRELRRACKKQDLADDAIPSYRACLHFVDALPRGHREPSTLGPQKAEDRNLPVLRMRHDDVAPMELAVLDHTQLDIAVNYFSRACFPWVTLFLDWHSRYPLGLWIAETPSSFTVAMAARMTFILFGAPAKVLADQGRDMRGKYIAGDAYARRKFHVPDWSPSSPEPEAAAMRGVLQSAGVRHIWFAKGRRPQTKGVIERLFGTCNRDFSRHLYADFYRGGNTRERGPVVDPLITLHNQRVRRGEESPLPDVRDVAARLFAWFYEDYAHREHTGHGMDGRTPHQAFRPGRALPAAQVGLLLMKREARTVANCAVRVLNNFYESPELYHHNGHECEVAYDPNQLVFEDFVDVIVYCCGEAIPARCARALSVTGVDRLEVQRRIAARASLRKSQAKLAADFDAAAPHPFTRRPSPEAAMRTQPKTDVPVDALVRRATPRDAGGMVPVAPADPRYARPVVTAVAPARTTFISDAVEEDAALFASATEEGGDD